LLSAKTEKRRAKHDNKCACLLVTYFGSFALSTECGNLLCQKYNFILVLSATYKGRVLVVFIFLLLPL